MATTGRPALRRMISTLSPLVDSTWTPVHAASHGHGPGADELLDAETLQEGHHGLYLALITGDFKGQLVRTDVNHLAPENNPQLTPSQYSDDIVHDSPAA